MFSPSSYLILSVWTKKKSMLKNLEIYYIWGRWAYYIILDRQNFGGAIAFLTFSPLSTSFWCHPPPIYISSCGPANKVNNARKLLISLPEDCVLPYRHWGYGQKQTLLVTFTGSLVHCNPGALHGVVYLLSDFTHIFALPCTGSNSQDRQCITTCRQ